MDSLPTRAEFLRSLGLDHETVAGCWTECVECSICRTGFHVRDPDINTPYEQSSEQLPERPVRLHGTHFFGEDCLHTWLAENNTCPICRMILFQAETEMDQDARYDYDDAEDDLNGYFFEDARYRFEADEEATALADEQATALVDEARALMRRNSEWFPDDDNIRDDLRHLDLIRRFFMHFPLMHLDTFDGQMLFSIYATIMEELVAARASWFNKGLTRINETYYWEYEAAVRLDSLQQTEATVLDADTAIRALRFRWQVQFMRELVVGKATVASYPRVVEVATIIATKLRWLNGESFTGAALQLQLTQAVGRAFVEPELDRPPRPIQIFPCFNGYLKDLTAYVAHSHAGNLQPSRLDQVFFEGAEFFVPWNIPTILAAPELLPR